VDPADGLEPAWRRAWGNQPHEEIRLIRRAWSREVVSSKLCWPQLLSPSFSSLLSTLASSLDTASPLPVLATSSLDTAPAPSLPRTVAMGQLTGTADVNAIEAPVTWKAYLM